MAVINIPGNLDGKIMKAVTKDFGEESKSNVEVLDTLKDGIKIANIKVDGKDNIINAPDDSDLRQYIELLKSAINTDNTLKAIISFKLKGDPAQTTLGDIFQC